MQETFYFLSLKFCTVPNISGETVSTFLKTLRFGMSEFSMTLKPSLVIMYDFQALIEGILATRHVQYRPGIFFNACLEATVLNLWIEKAMVCDQLSLIVMNLHLDTKSFVVSEFYMFVLGFLLMFLYHFSCGCHLYPFIQFIFQC